MPSVRCEDDEALFHRSHDRVLGATLGQTSKHRAMSSARGPTGAMSVIESDGGGEIMPWEDAAVPDMLRDDQVPPPERGDEGDVLSDDEMKMDEDKPEEASEPDFVDEVDERRKNPTLYLTKFWRLVSPQAPIYHCYRNPQVGKYSCTLNLHLPPKGTRIYKAPAHYDSKRHAKRAVSQHAMATGIVEQAKQSMAAMDRVGTAAAPRFYKSQLPQRDERYNETDELSRREATAAASAENPVTALNLAVQKYCVESPNQALLYEQQAEMSKHALHHVFRCHLQIRVTPDNTVSYNTSKTYNSVKESREAAARLALADGIVHRLKMENSLTSKIHKQLGLPVPTDLDAHDTVDEENTAGSLTQLVQQVTRNTAALQCEYTKAPGGSGELFGARLSITIKPGNTQHYEIDPTLRTKRDAKEAVCRLAVKQGVRRTLEAQKRLIDASRVITNGLNLTSNAAAITAAPASLAMPRPGTVTAEQVPLLQNPVGYLNSCLQLYLGRQDVLDFDFTEEGARNGLGRNTAPSFGCTLTARLKPGVIRKYTIDASFPSKKSAKDGVARAALRQGLVELAKNVKQLGTSASHPSLDREMGAPADPAQETIHAKIASTGYPAMQSSGLQERAVQTTVHEDHEMPYATATNPRLSHIPILQPQTLETMTVSPPPYSHRPLTASTLSGAAVSTAIPARTESSNPFIARENYMAVDASPSSARQAPTGPHAVSEAERQRMTLLMKPMDQPLVRAIEDVARRLRPDDWSEHVKYDVHKDPETDKYSAILTVFIAGRDPIVHSIHGISSQSMAEEAVATKALDKGILGVMEKAWGASRENGKDGEGSGEPTAVDPFPQPISYLHQACQMLIGVESYHRPAYDLFKASNSSDYGAVLTIPINPPAKYRVEAVYRSKALAKEAVTHRALEDSIVEQMKEHHVISLAPMSEKAQAILARRAEDKAAEEKKAVEVAGEVSARTTESNEGQASKGKTLSFSGSWVTGLQEYCITTSRPSPEYTEKSTASSTVSLVDVSVKIGDESFELDQTKIKKIGSQQETPKDFLARKVLRHLRKRDEEAGTTKVTLN